MSAVVTEIITTLTSGISGIAQGIGSGLSTLVKSIFLDSTAETTKLSTFGGLVVVFAGVSLAIGLSRWAVNWVTSLGASH